MTREETQTVIRNSGTVPPVSPVKCFSEGKDPITYGSHSTRMLIYIRQELNHQLI